MKRIAVVCTVYNPKAHADVIVSKFLRGFPTDDGIMYGHKHGPPRIDDATPPHPATLTAAGARSAPKVKIATMYIDQPGGFPSSKPTPVEQLPMGIRMAEKYGVKLVHSIREALCMRDDGTMPPQTGEGADEVAVDGILAIGEHGEPQLQPAA